MAARRSDIVLKSLLSRGVPGVWATEEEAAVLSGMCSKSFRAKRLDLEAHGFPKIDPINGKRFIPAILTFWERRAQANALAPQEGPHVDEQEKEMWA